MENIYVNVRSYPFTGSGVIALSRLRLSLVNLDVWTSDFLNVFLQCFDTVGWVIWPVKPVTDMTYNVFGGTLSLTRSINESQCHHCQCHVYLVVFNCDEFSWNASVHLGEIKVQNGLIIQTHRLTYGQTHAHTTLLLYASGTCRQRKQ